jgi:TIR domain
MMSDIFVSYAREDRDTAERIAQHFGGQGWDVFWDQHIRGSLPFAKVIERELEAARCVVVLLSRATADSAWVPEEAAVARRRRVLLPVLIEDMEVPFGYQTIQTLSLSGWDGGPGHPGLKRLTDDVDKLVGRRRPRVSVPEPSPSEPVTSDHLVLVHSCWRVPHRDADFGGQPMYQIHVILYGSRSALDRVSQVEYELDPSYPDPLQTRTDRARNFELKELANGYSVIHAHVSIKGQVDTVHLSRFINLTETGPRLDIEFMRADAAQTSA